MDRAEIKSLAREKIKGNKLTLWMPILIIMGIFIVASLISSLLTSILGVIGIILDVILMFTIFILYVAYIAFLLKFVRGEEVSFGTIVDCFKEKWLQLLVTSIVVYVFVFLWSLLLFIPGIVKMFAYAMALFITIDTDLCGGDAIEESMKMMNGYKLDYFIFILSFIGWAFLAPFTLGILYIWLMPYMMVAQTIYYEKLKENYYGGVQATVTATEEKEVEPIKTVEEPVKVESKPEIVNEEPAVPSLGDVIVGGASDVNPISNDDSNKE